MRRRHRTHSWRSMKLVSHCSSDWSVKLPNGCTECTSLISLQCNGKGEWGRNGDLHVEVKFNFNDHHGGHLQTFGEH